jgi:hypothetical protein
VTSVHRAVVFGRTKTCQKVFRGSLRVPIATTATTPVDVVNVVSSEALISGCDESRTAEARGN